MSLAVLVLSPSLVSLAFTDVGRSFVIKTISLGEEGWENGSPSSIAINPQMNLVYVANRNSNESPDNITVINSTSNEVVGSINVGRPAIGVAVNPNTGTIYSANGYSTASAINGTTNEVLATFDYSDSSEYGADVQNIAVNTKTNKVYVLLMIVGEALVSVIDGATNEIESTFKVADLQGDYDVIEAARDIAVNSKTNMVYVANDFDSLIVIDGSDNRVVKTIKVEEGPTNIAVNEKTNTIYTSNFFSQSVSVINGSNNTVIDTIKPFFDPQKMTVDEKTNTLYLASYGEGVSIIDGVSYEVKNWMPLGQFSEGIGFNPNNGMLYVSNAGSNSISIIQTANEPRWETVYTLGKFLYSEPPIPDQIFKVKYRVINGTADKFVAQPFGAAATVSAEGNGLLEIMYPRNYPYTNNISGMDMADPLFVVNGSQESPLESVTTGCFFKFSIPFTDKSEIELAWTYLAIEQFYHGDYVWESCLPETLVLEALTPVQQSRAGVQPQNIVCPEELLLVIDPTYKPYCATPASAEILKERWK